MFNVFIIFFRSFQDPEQRTITTMDIPEPIFLSAATAARRPRWRNKQVINRWIDWIEDIYQIKIN